MALRFFNTLTQQLEEFAPLNPPVVRMYTCGPTVYHYVHIGNFRSFTFQDILRRWLKIRGYELQHVMNITDVEDKIIRNAMARNVSIGEYTAEYEKAFLDDSAMLRLERPERLVRATEHIQEMIDAIQALADGGHTYQSDGSTYFRIASFPEYGRLSRLHFDGMQAGARVDVDEYEKDDARDFVLWKGRKDGEPYWDSPFGQGRPGWHIECSAMANKYLGETLDIHTGGIDLTFPHHENEIAQAECVNHKQFVRVWLHAEHLIVEGQKMSKSLGNFYTLRDVLERGFSPEAIRYRLAAVPYRNKLNFTFADLEAAETAIERLRNFELRVKTSKFGEGANAEMSERVAKARQEFEEHMDDDLNTAAALGVIFEYVRVANAAMDAGSFLSRNATETLDLLALFDRVFDVLRPTKKESALSDEEIDALVAERQQARKARDFKRSDEIRDQLAEMGVILEDTRDGVRWKRK
jgi:cysteinyl-tRNA synthetase